MKRTRQEWVLGGMAGKRMVVGKKNARRDWASGVAGIILPPGLAIPCWVAPLQSPTPFRQAQVSVARIVAPGKKFLPRPRRENRHKRLPGRLIQNRQKRLSARGGKTPTIRAGQIGIPGIMVTRTRLSPNPCRF